MHAVSAAGNELECDDSLTAQETLCLRKVDNKPRNGSLSMFQEKFGLNGLISSTLHFTYTQSFFV